MSKKPYYLFLDDSPRRDPNNIGWIDLPKADWVIVRNYKDFVKTILRDGLPKVVSFDHDLHDEHYAEYFRVQETRFVAKIDYSRFKVKSGWHCAKWLADYCVAKQIPIPPYYVHTMNGPGASNIFNVLENARKQIK